jgi:hypothetical protein
MYLIRHLLNNNGEPARCQFAPTTEYTVDELHFHKAIALNAAHKLVVESDSTSDIVVYMTTNSIIITDELLNFVDEMISYF